jgi:hypothetical protein
VHDTDANYKARSFCAQSCSHLLDCHRHASPPRCRLPANAHEGFAKSCDYSTNETKNQHLHN